MTDAKQNIKERPIIFSGEMVRAILDGRKTQTRRPMKVQPPGDGYKIATCMCTTGPKKHIGMHHWVKVANDGYTVVDAPNKYFKCPYGKPGDRLWVRETWANQNSRFPSMAPLYMYRADNNNYTGYIKWRPSIYMPRAASRLLLEITSVRVERLNEISEKDALSEGVKADVYLGDTPTAIVPFAMLWQSIHGPESWEQNPWVWVVGFKRL